MKKEKVKDGKKTLHYPIWKREDWDFIDTPTKKLFLSFPNHLDNILQDLYRSPLRSEVLEIFLKEFEKEAQTLLKRNGYPPDPVKLLKNQNKIKDSTSMEALRVLVAAQGVRRAILSNNAKEAAIEMMRLVFSAHIANLRQVVLRGIRATTAPSRGGRISKKNEGLILIIRVAFEKSKNKTASGLWKFIKLNYTKEEFNSKYGKIFFIDEDDPYWEFFKEDGILIAKKRRMKSQHLDITKEKFVPYNTFKRYVGEVKKSISKNK
jgi:hypothetical protein